MDMRNEVVTDTTHPYLIRIIRAYNPTPIPARKDLMEDNYEKTMPQTTGWLNLKDLCEQVGVTYKKEDDYE